MTTNQHTIDRVARIVLAAVIIAATMLNAFGQYLSWVFVAIGIVLIITGALGICPIYSAFRFSSKNCGCKSGGCCTR